MPAGRAAAKKGKRRRLPLKTCFGGGSLLKAGSENAGGQDCGEKGKAPAATVKNMFRLAVLCQRPVLKMPTGRAAAKKESTGGYR